jgi:hypothetical protein
MPPSNTSAFSAWNKVKPKMIEQDQQIWHDQEQRVLDEQEQLIRYEQEQRVRNEQLEEYVLCELIAILQSSNTIPSFLLK